MQKVGLLALVLLLAGCGYRLVPSEVVPGDEGVPGVSPGMHGGTAWGEGAFDSNGERIYFTATNDRGERIRYTGEPQIGMMMGGYLACASCHGPDGRGGEHFMHMQVMDAPDIRWSALVSEDEEHREGEHGEHSEYDFEDFRTAVVEGQHPDGDQLSTDMPRWEIGNSDLSDLAEYLMSLP